MKKEKHLLTACIVFFFIVPANAGGTGKKEQHTESVRDSVLNIGYAQGSLINLSGSVERITEQQMNKEQITNPLEAIQGRVAGLTILKSSNGMAALSPCGCGNHFADKRKRSAHHR